MNATATRAESHTQTRAPTLRIQPWRQKQTVASRTMPGAPPGPRPPQANKPPTWLYGNKEGQGNTDQLKPAPWSPFHESVQTTRPTSNNRTSWAAQIALSPVAGSEPLSDWCPWKHYTASAMLPWRDPKPLAHGQSRGLKLLATASSRHPHSARDSRPSDPCPPADAAARTHTASPTWKSTLPPPPNSPRPPRSRNGGPEKGTKNPLVGPSVTAPPGGLVAGRRLGRSSAVRCEEGRGSGSSVAGRPGSRDLATGRAPPL